MSINQHQWVLVRVPHMSSFFCPAMCLVYAHIDNNNDNKLCRP